MNSAPGCQATLRLEIDPVIANAEHAALRVQRDLPGHEGLTRASQGVVAAACEAKRVAAALRRPWGLHRLPVFFLAVALLVLASWIYGRFFRVSTLTIAVPERDAVELRERLGHSRRVRVEVKLTNGSSENVALLRDAQVDVAFVQGGIEIPASFPRRKTGQAELALMFMRDDLNHPRQIRCILTSVEGQGSHAVAQQFTKLWGIADQTRYIHDWKQLADDPDYQLPSDVDAVFVVKDPANERTFRAAERLKSIGFSLRSPDLGARAVLLDYLNPTTIPAHYLGWNPVIPAQPTETYAVSSYLVAREGLTPRLLAAATHLLDPESASFAESGFEPTVGEASEVLQGVEALLGIAVYIGLLFLALLGWEITTYRRRFHELNTLISLISIHQSDKDVLGLDSTTKRRENLLYLSICSDLLGLISVITGYYAQENSSLLYSNLLDIIMHRCSGLKLNIQTKILHAAIRLDPEPEPTRTDQHLRPTSSDLQLAESDTDDPPK